MLTRDVIVVVRAPPQMGKGVCVSVWTDMETRMDATEALYRSQDTRLLYLEAYTKVVLRGFSSVGDFLKDKERDFKLAKQVFIAAFVHEFRDKAFAEATHVLEEAETLLCENNGVVVVGVFPTGGHHGTHPDGVLRLQGRSYLLLACNCGQVSSGVPSSFFGPRSAQQGREGRRQGQGQGRQREWQGEVQTSSGQTGSGPG